MQFKEKNLLNYIIYVDNQRVTNKIIYSITVHLLTRHNISHLIKIIFATYSLD